MIIKRLYKSNKKYDTNIRLVYNPYDLYKN